HDGATTLALQGDGKIVAGGWTIVNGSTSFALARYNANGTLDTTFGTGGKVITSIGNSFAQPNAMAIKPDGRIVIAGYATTNTGNTFALARYNSNGTLDSSFGIGGTVTTTFGPVPGSSFTLPGSAYARSVAIQSDGKIVVAGFAQVDEYEFALARYNTNGTL